MSLPKIDVPVFNFEIPSTKQKIKFRPFLVKEEKILLYALEENTEESIVTAVKQIITNCTFDKLDVDKLTTFDLEYLFLQLRIKSKTNHVELEFTCSNECTKEDGIVAPCGHRNRINFNLDDVKLEYHPEHSKKIILAGNLGIIMRYPSFDMVKEFQTQSSDSVDTYFNVFSKLVESVFEGEKVYEEFTEKDLHEFFESLTDEQFSKVKKFFETMPKLVANIPMKCSKCGHSESVKVEGLHNFLG